MTQLQMLGPEARRAVDVARSEARDLGHAQMGTEHVLLGILAGDSDAAGGLVQAGASRSAVWGKVRETRTSDAGATGVAPEASARAARAINRSTRFARQRHGGPVTPEDLLIGVLDVEGTAGQVLRSIGVDVEDLRALLDGAEPDEASAMDAARERTAPTCPACGCGISHVAHRRVPSDGPDRTLDVVLHACPECNVVLGLTPA